MKNLVLITLMIIMLPLAIYAQCGNCANHNSNSDMDKIEMANSKVVRNVFEDTNKLYAMDDEFNVKVRWDAKPRIGTKLLIVEVYDKKGRLSDDLSVTGNAYMPSMRGAHDTGHTAFTINKKKAQVLPVNFMMLGDWEIELKFYRGKTNVYTAYVKAKI